MFGPSKKGSAMKGLAHTLVSCQTEIVGDIRFSGELIVEGRVKGNVYADDESGAVVRVAQNGIIEGDLWVPSAVINGLIQGDIHSSKHVELGAKAVVMGDVFYDLIEMVMGSEINGSLTHIARAQQEAKRLAAGQSRVLAYEGRPKAVDQRSKDQDNETIVD